MDRDGVLAEGTTVDQLFPSFRMTTTMDLPLHVGACHRTLAGALAMHVNGNTVAASAQGSGRLRVKLWGHWM